MKDKKPRHAPSVLEPRHAPSVLEPWNASLEDVHAHLACYQEKERNHTPFEALLLHKYVI